MRTGMDKFMFVRGKRKSDGTWPIYLRDGRTLIAFVCLPDGPGCGYKYRFPTRKHWSAKRYRTIEDAKTGIGLVL